ncbi:MAG: DUF2169 domain-containing protein [Polyangiaceae bacterium]|nr:DUF2169 domain-containing protein [Polyangiaceae bacterium]
MDVEWPVEIEPLGPVAVGTVLWRWAGQVNVTIVVKACFALEPGGVMRVCAPEPLRVADEHFGGQPTRSICGAREIAPQLAACDVTLVGHAYAPQGGATRMAVRLAMNRDGHTVLDKTLHVYGDRGPDGEPARFEVMPLEHERALGGIGFADNPLGVGAPGSPERKPNLVAVDAPGTRVAVLAPIPAMFPARRKLLRGLPRRKVESLLAELPDDFDWSYFQAAPEDQRLQVLRGDEWLGLDGLHPTVPRLQTRLPGLRGWARVLGHERVGAPDTVPLRADMLHIEPDRNCCTLVCRGGFPLVDEAGARRIRVLGTLAPLGAAITWPAEPAAPARVAVAPRRAAVPVPAGPVGMATVATLPDRGEHLGTVAPFKLAPADGPRQGYRPVEPLPGAPWSAAAPASCPGGRAVPRPVEGESETMQLDLGTANDAVRDATRLAAEALGFGADGAPARSSPEPPGVAPPAARAAELEAVAEADAARRRTAELEAAAAERAAAEAEARRVAEAERFQTEQEAARQVQLSRAEEERRHKRDAAQAL